MVMVELSDRTTADRGVGKDTVDGTRAQTDERCQVEGRDQLPKLLIGDQGRHPFIYLEPLRPGHRSRVDNNDMALDEEIEELPDTCQMLFFLLEPSREHPHVLADIAGSDLMDAFIGVGLMHGG